MFNASAGGQGAVLANVSSRNKIRVTGNDRITVLHRLLTQDIRALSPGQGAPAALLSARGKVLALMNVFVFEDSLRLDLDENCGSRTTTALEKLIITENAVLTAEKGWGHLVLAGRSAADVLKAAGLPAPAEPQARHFYYELFLFDGKRGVIAQTRTGYFEIMIEENFLPPLRGRLLESGKNLNLQEISQANWEVFRTDHGILKFGVDVTEEETLPETDLDQRLASETKGCYPGQEVVARTNTYKGHAKKMRGIILGSSNIPSSGSRISERGEDIGYVTSACFSAQRNSAVCLAYLKRGSFEEGLNRTLKIGDDVFKADVLSLEAFSIQP